MRAFPVMFTGLMPGTAFSAAFRTSVAEDSFGAMTMGSAVTPWRKIVRGHLNFAIESIPPLDKHLDQTPRLQGASRATKPCPGPQPRTENFVGGRGTATRRKSGAGRRMASR